MAEMINIDVEEKIDKAIEKGDVKDLLAFQTAINLAIKVVDENREILVNRRSKVNIKLRELGEKTKDIEYIYIVVYQDYTEKAFKTRIKARAYVQSQPQEWQDDAEIHRMVLER